ncbi:DUF1080 domain-containing protein [Pelagicoccus sp. SDUM812002]|uniref:3-keto-disaccharide hydrolase n=1 Tax=Pelagicoccus sp. SDUM812002 TaxID=3041266 RepID=UPI00281080CA|nr:DUF1080 domain-containing protein [Pelagicoccus sp. SDUM812002]MDQ8188363.1 DUF1080 domain-containing protein [Pelagicoccus sp. SDUM812002]
MLNLPNRVSLIGAVVALQGIACGEPIFNGRSLDGWHIMQMPSDDPYHATEDNFFVEDGAIVCAQTEQRKGGLLLTDATFIDFELKLEMKSDWGCDSGVFIRCTNKGQGIQIMNDYLPGGNVGGLYGQGTGGYLSRPIQLAEGTESGSVLARNSYDGVEIDGLVYFIDADGWNELWKASEWNTLRIRCVGAEPRITTWVNDVKVMEMDGRVCRARHLEDVNNANWDAKPAWDQELIQSITGNAGRIGLQIHPGNRWKAGGTVRYRSIVLTPIK